MRIVSLLLVMLFSATCLAKPDAFEIMKAVDEREDGDSMISVQTLLLANGRGQKLTRQIKTFSRDQGRDRKSILFMLKPADVRNIGFMSYLWRSTDADNDNWLYLPALDRVERIPQSDRSDAFMGSDFSYADMDGYKLEEWDYKLVQESVELNGKDCYLIEATPKPELADELLDETGYARMEHWVRKDLDMVVQSKLYVAQSSRMKLLTADDIRQIEGIWTPFRLTMRSYKGERLEHASVLLINDVQYNQAVEEAMFTTGRLRQGL